MNRQPTTVKNAQDTLHNTTRLFTVLVGGRLRDNLCELLDSVIQDKHQSITHASENTRLCTLEKISGSFITSNFPPAVERARVHDISSFVPCLQHCVATNSVKQVRSQPSHCCDGLCSRPADEDVSTLGVWEHSLCSVIDPEVGSR